MFVIQWQMELRNAGTTNRIRLFQQQNNERNEKKIANEIHEKKNNESENEERKCVKRERKAADMLRWCLRKPTQNLVATFTRMFLLFFSLFSFFSGFINFFLLCRFFITIA